MVNRLAVEYARVIVRWHQEIGADLAPQRMSIERQHEYQERVSGFANSGLDNPHVLHELARLQLSGIFEYFYGEIVPVRLFSGFLRERHAEPLSLSAAAREILSLLEPESERREEPAQGGRKVVRFETQQQLVHAAHEFYRPFSAEAQDGLGGVELLLSCSLERSGHDRGEVTLLAPDVLGFEIVTHNSRENDLLDHLRSGTLRIDVQGQSQIA